MNSEKKNGFTFLKIFQVSFNNYLKEEEERHPTKNFKKFVVLTHIYYKQDLIKVHFAQVLN